MLRSGAWSKARLRVEGSQTRLLLVISRSKFVNDKWMIKNGFLNDVQEHKPW